MGLTSSLYLGNSALTAAQLAIQVTGNNLANAATPGYSRQRATLVPMRADTSGRLSVGTGVRVTDVRRQIDEALMARLWGGLSHESASAQEHGVLAQIETILGELGEHDLSSELSGFFNSWSERANLSQSSAVVVQQGQRLADYVQRLRTNLSDQRTQMDQQLSIQAGQANGLLTQIADLNRAVSDAEAAGGTANTLRDQRDELVGQLSQFMDVTTIEQSNGSIDILVGSTPVVLGGDSRGIELRRTSDGTTVSVSLNVIADGQQLRVQSGAIGAGLAGRDEAVDAAITKLDRIAAQLIFQVNRVHSTSSNARGLLAASGTLSMPIADRSRALNDPANTALSGLPFAATSGGIEVRVVSPNGDVETVRIDIDLDGQRDDGSPGFEDDTSINDIQAALDSIGGLTASLTPDGKLKIDAEADFSFSFASDSSGALAVLGVNSYFTGSSAADIGIREELKSDPTLLAVGRYVNGEFVENAGALEMSGLQDLALDALDGVSIKKSWIDTVQELGVKTDAAGSRSQAASIVRQSLDAQRAAVSGVSIDEESINLLTYQRQYQGAARFISVVDELTQTLMALV